MSLSSRAIRSADALIDMIGTDQVTQRHPDRFKQGDLAGRLSKRNGTGTHFGQLADDRFLADHAFGDRHKDFTRFTEAVVPAVGVQF